MSANFGGCRLRRHTREQPQSIQSLETVHQVGNHRAKALFDARVGVVQILAGREQQRSHPGLRVEAERRTDQRHTECVRPHRLAGAEDACLINLGGKAQGLDNKLLLFSVKPFGEECDRGGGAIDGDSVRDGNHGADYHIFNRSQPRGNPHTWLTHGFHVPRKPSARVRSIRMRPRRPAVTSPIHQEESSCLDF